MSQEESSSVNWLLIAALGFLSLLVLGVPVADIVLEGNFLELSLPLNVVAYSRFVNAIGSLILTLSLVFLYYQQTRTQEKQEEWMEAEHTPDVSVDRWEVDKNMVELDLTNPGNGAAKDLRVGVEIESLYGGYAGRHTTSVVGRWDLFGADVTSRVIESRQSETVTFETRNPPTLTLQVGGSRTSFRDSGWAYEDSLSDVLDVLCMGEADGIEYTVTLHYDYVKRGTNAVSFWGGTAEIEPGMRFEDVIMETDSDDAIRMGVTPDNLKEV